MIIKHNKTSIVKRGAFLLAAPVLALAFGVGAAVAAPAGKTTICHYDADYDVYKAITISNNAQKAHDRHGDMIYDDKNCTSYNSNLLVQTLTVDSTSTEAVSSAVLNEGENYRFEVSGTYSYATWTGSEEADAKFSYRTTQNNFGYLNQWVDGSELPAPYTNYLQLWVDGAAVDWQGDLTEDHTYTLDYTGAGSSVDFVIQDGGQVADNNGTLTVKIYRL